MWRLGNCWNYSCGRMLKRRPGEKVKEELADVFAFAFRHWRKIWIRRKRDLVSGSGEKLRKNAENTRWTSVRCGTAKSATSLRQRDRIPSPPRTVSLEGVLQTMREAIAGKIVLKVNVKIGNWNHDAGMLQIKSWAQSPGLWVGRWYCATNPIPDDRGVAQTSSTADPSKPAVIDFIISGQTDDKLNLVILIEPAMVGKSRSTAKRTVVETVRTRAAICMGDTPRHPSYQAASLAPRCCRVSMRVVYTDIISLPLLYCISATEDGVIQKLISFWIYSSRACLFPERMMRSKPRDFIKKHIRYVRSLPNPLPVREQGVVAGIRPSKMLPSSCLKLIRAMRNRWRSDWPESGGPENAGNPRPSKC